MPKFYFDISDGPDLTSDRFGDEFVDLSEARAHAQAILAKILEEEMPDGEDRVFVCTVRDQEHEIVYTGRLTYHGVVARSVGSDS